MVNRLFPWVALILVLALAACGRTDAEPASPPSHTPAPTAMTIATNTPVPTATTSDTNTLSPEVALHYGLSGDAVSEGLEHSSAGDHRAAIASFKKALEIHGQPSRTLEGWIARAYYMLEEYEAAIEHYSNVIEADRNNDGLILNAAFVDRARAYLGNGQCMEATSDAQAALAPEAVTSQVNVDADAEANYMLAICYEHYGLFEPALRHLEASIAIAEANQYPKGQLAELKEWRERLQAK